MSHRIAIACGGTAGHVHPAFAIADAYRRRVPGVDIRLLGGSGGFEARLAGAHGHRLTTIPAAPFLRVGLLGKMRALVTTAVGAVEARRVLRSHRIDLVLGLGNYACAPTVLAARSLGIPIVLHEANAVAGLANRLLGRLADRVLVGFESAAAAFATPTIVTGTPVRPEILAIAAAPRLHPSLRTDAPFRILVSGGSQGSPFLDAHVPELLARVARRGHELEVLHQATEGSVARTAAAYAGAAMRARVVPHIDDMADAYGRADLAVVSAGAGTLSEVAAVGLPALVVPLGTAALDHQAANARAFADATGTPWVPESDWDVDALAAHVTTLVTSPAAWSEASSGVRRFARPEAAAAVVRACEDVLTAASRRGAGDSRAP